MESNSKQDGHSKDILIIEDDLDTDRGLLLLWPLGNPQRMTQVQDAVELASFGSLMHPK